MRVASYDIGELEGRIGPRGTTPINSENRALVQNWLCAQGFTSAWSKGRRVSTLFKAYNKPSYFAKLVELRDKGVLYELGSRDMEEDVETSASPTLGKTHCSEHCLPIPCPECRAKTSPTHVAPVGGAHGELVLTAPAKSALRGAVESMERGIAASEQVPSRDVAMIKRLRESGIDLSLTAAVSAYDAGYRVNADGTIYNLGGDSMTVTIDADHAAAAHAASETDMKLSAAAEALRAASILAKTHEALLERITALESRGGMPNTPAAPVSIEPHGAGTIPGTVMVKAGDVFEGIGGDMLVPRFTERSEYVPEVDAGYAFDPDTTLAILLGFAHNRRVLISGRHGTGKSSHVEQVAARLNWPSFRLNLDGHMSRTDLIGRDAVVINEDGKQITEFREGILPWAMQQPMALCLDEYDAGRPDVLFVVQRLLETSGKLTIAEQNRVVEPNIAFRIFGTANTVGLGDASGLYHGTNALNAAQMDRWSMTVRLDYLPEEHEIKIVLGKVPAIGTKVARSMVRTAAATRALFTANKISTVMSPRTVISWAENTQLLGGDTNTAFRFTFANKCDDGEMSHIETCYNTNFAGARAGSDD